MEYAMVRCAIGTRCSSTHGVWLERGDSFQTVIGEVCIPARFYVDFPLLFYFFGFTFRLRLFDRYIS